MGSFSKVLRQRAVDMLKNASGADDYDEKAAQLCASVLLSHAGDLERQETAESAAYDGLMRAKEGFRAEAHRQGQELAQCRAERDALVKALEEIMKGEGPFSHSPLTHAVNTIDAMKEIASNALSQLARPVGRPLNSPEGK